MATYVTSCNVQRFDILQFFENEKQVYWKQISRCMNGDTVYIYVGRPHSRLMYKCLVLETNIDDVVCNYLAVNQNKKSKFMKIELVEEIKNHIGLDDLLTNGLKTVQCATQASPELVNYIEKRKV